MIKKLFISGLVLFAALWVSPSHSAIVLQPGAEGKDTWIWNNEDWSHGNWGELRANQTSSYLQYILIAFDLSSLPSSLVISSAKLELYRYDGYNDSGLYLDAHRITSPWNEDVTWSTRPGFDPNVESSAYITGNGWYSWDLTSLVQQWINGTVDNYGVAIYDHGSSYYQRFVSSDNMEATEPSWALPPKDPNLRPKLVITPVPIPATMLLLGSGLIGLAGMRKKSKM